MRTTEERIGQLHKRADLLEKRRNRNALTALGGLSFGLCVCLIVAITVLNGTSHRTISGQFAGASLLGDQIGGYVLVAVLSFTAAMIITVICMRRRGSTKGTEEQEEETDKDRIEISDERKEAYHGEGEK